MADRLRPHLAKFHRFVQGKREGDIVSTDDILAATGWEPATIDAHRVKNALDPFFNEIERDRFRVRRDGITITPGEVSKAFTQIRPAELKLSEGVRVTGDLGTYELVRELGRGAVAQVWSCVRILGRKQYAAKIVSPRTDLLEPSTLDNVKQRFALEAQNGKKISHPNVVQYVDYGTYKEAHPLLIMELAEGGSVAAWLRAGALSLPDSLDVILACARGLEHLHSHGLVHRDVKPDNMLRFPSRVVLGDLGIVKWSEWNRAFTTAGTLTKASVQLGSWYYMAPEQRNDPHEAMAGSDIYALGISWYEMLTSTMLDPVAVGAQAFPDPSAVDAVNLLIRDMVRYKTSERPTASDLVRRVEQVQSRL